LSPGAASRSRSSSPELSSPGKKSPLPEPPSAAYKRGRQLPGPPHLTTAASQQPSPLPRASQRRRPPSTAATPLSAADPFPRAAPAQGEHGDRIPSASPPFSPIPWSPMSTGPPAGTPGRPPARPLSVLMRAGGEEGEGLLAEPPPPTFSFFPTKP
jgi:hypothetical protein